MGVIRHVDAGYERAIEVARERGVRIPMRDGGRDDGGQAGPSPADDSVSASAGISRIPA